MSYLTLALVPAFPFLLLGLMLLMERVERPLRDGEVALDLEGFLATARPDEVETFVSEGFSAAVDRYWRRRRGAPAAAVTGFARRGRARARARVEA